MKTSLFFLAVLFSNSLFGQANTDSLRVVNQVDSLIKVLRKLTGERNYEKALEINAAAEKIALDNLGRESAAYGACCFNLGRVNYFKGNYPEAELHYLEAIAIREKTLGKEHPDYAWSLNNLAVLYSDKGDYEKAEPLHLEALAIREKTIGMQHPDYASSLNNLAALYVNMCHYKKAEPLFLEALAIREKTLGKEHPDYAMSCGRYRMCKPRN